MKKYDYLIVGAGLSGIVLAERLSNILNKKVLVIDKRENIGGNCYDFLNSNGILIHKYGPHYFRTNSDIAIDYLSKFTDWISANYIIRSFVNGKLYCFPINVKTINKFFDIQLKTEDEAKDFLNSKKKNILNPKNFEEQLLSIIGSELYDAFYKSYTEKQWGISPVELDKSIALRIPLRYDDNEKYFIDKFQMMPRDGYTSMFSKMLKGINVLLNTDFFSLNKSYVYENLIYTGRIDEFFKFKFGKLPYRSLRFEFEDYPEEFYQDYVQINYPNDNDYTRVIEIKHITGQKSFNTTIVKEYPCNDGEPFYPILTEKNNILYNEYKKESEKLRKVYFLGRLAEYKYLNMDFAVLNALRLFDRIKNENQ